MDDLMKAILTASAGYKIIDAMETVVACDKLLTDEGKQKLAGALRKSLENADLSKERRDRMLLNAMLEYLETSEEELEAREKAMA